MRSQFPFTFDSVVVGWSYLFGNGLNCCNVLPCHFCNRSNRRKDPEPLNSSLPGEYSLFLVFQLQCITKSLV